MVIRYWNAEGPEPSAFADLVEREHGGIRATRLVRDLGRRGHPVRSFSGDLTTLRGQVAEGRPVVTLLEVAPDRFHYVVVVSVLPEGVLFHDPARAPFMFQPAEEFRHAWSASGSWAMVLLPARKRTEPGAKTALPDRTGGRDEPAGDGCARLVDRGVDWAGQGRLEEAGAVLEAAADRCPAAAGAWRELAGVRFRQQRWAEAEEAASRAAAGVPADTHALRILAASRYLRDDEPGALRAWNRVGEPSMEALRAYGLQRVPYRSLEEHLGLPAEGILTPSLLRRTRRRGAAFPGLDASRVGFRPTGTGGRSQLRIAVVERPGVPPSGPRIARLAIRSLASRRIEFEAGGPAALAWTVTARPWSPRPEAGVMLSVPGLFGLPGRWTAEGSWWRETYGPPAGSEGLGGPEVDASPLFREERLVARLLWSRWAGADLRLRLHAGLYRWPGRGRAGALGGGLEWRSPDDRLAAGGRTTGWSGPGGGSAFARWRVALAGRSAAGRRGFVARGRLGYRAATAGAPPSEWPGAGVGIARSALLRAHPLLDEGILRGVAFGRRLASAGGEANLWLEGIGPLRVAPAAFVDAARAWGRIGDTSPSDLHVDVGLGLRLAGGSDGGTLRVDLARGLRDGETTLSLGWTPEDGPLLWPG